MSLRLKPLVDILDERAGTADRPEERPKPVGYEYGSRGPKEIDEFTERFGYKRSEGDD